MKKAFPKTYDHSEAEYRIQTMWENDKIYKFENQPDGKLFSVDTPPPYISAANLHVGHAMSYSQAEFVVRYMRMNGRKVFYPMGFDDNGLPTERYVEKIHKIRSRKMQRNKFIDLCLNETRTIGEYYKKFWKNLGLSVDWNKFYSTISPETRKVAQWSFIDLYKKGEMYRSEAPVIWCPSCQTSLAQADIDSVERKTSLHNINFLSSEGTALTISTTRPELLPACVALFFNPDDERYIRLKEKTAKVPLFDYEVPILTDETVKMEFGTGLMMVCTFGDSEDVEKWQRHKLKLRQVVTANGHLTNLARQFAGMPLGKARKEIVLALKEKKYYEGSKVVKQVVGQHERCDTPHEYHILPQWYISVVKNKKCFLELGEKLDWRPESMKIRFIDWVNGLKWDWNISRQRFYGVPFPVWYCKECNEVILPSKDCLPVDPLNDNNPSVENCPNCGGDEFLPESDVMDTWMTSSMTPFINANWCGDIKYDLYPMTLRVQAYEIIRTWLFYTVVKGYYHSESLPWSNVMISGWGLNEQGKKISKRDLDKYTKNGYNPYNPDNVIKKYGADPLRYWAAEANLGVNHRYFEKEVKKGRRLVIKLWNAASLIHTLISQDDPRDSEGKMDIKNRSVADRWILSKVRNTFVNVSVQFEKYQYSHALHAMDELFWRDFCDNYLEFVKERFYNTNAFGSKDRLAASLTLIETFRSILSGYAPFTPFITEELYSIMYKEYENAKSIHITAWPQFDDTSFYDETDGDFLVEVVREIRKLRSQKKISSMTKVDKVVLSSLDDELIKKIQSVWTDLFSAARTYELEIASAVTPTEIQGLYIDIISRSKD